MARKRPEETLKLFKSAERGFGLQPKAFLEKGSLAIDERPVAHIVSNKERERKCSYCLGPTSFANNGILENSRPELRRCSSCKYVFYCGAPCQKKDWRLHKQECRNLRIVAPRRPPDICLLASRLLTVLVTQKTNTKQAGIGESQSVTLRLDQILSRTNALMTKARILLSETRREMFLTFAVVLQRFLDQTLIDAWDISFNDLQNLICWLTCNCFNILDEDLNSVGIGIFGKSCFINHSCTPNCVAVFEGSKVMIRTIRPVKDDEEITISYIESIERGEDRRDKLLERYLFKCKCQTCQADTGNNFALVGKCPNSVCAARNITDGSSMTCSGCGFSDFGEDFYLNLRRWYDNLRRKFETFTESKTSSNALILLDVAIEASSFVPGESFEMVKCNEALFDWFVDDENWKMARQTGSSLLNGYLHYYPDCHPVAGLHLFKLGKIELALENLRCGLDFLERCWDVLIVTHGKKHSLTRYLNATIVRLKGEIIHIDSKQTNS